MNDLDYLQEKSRDLVSMQTVWSHTLGYTADQEDVGRRVVSVARAAGGAPNVERRTVGQAAAPPQTVRRARCMLRRLRAP